MPACFLFSFFTLHLPLLSETLVGSADDVIERFRTSQSIGKFPRCYNRTVTTVLAKIISEFSLFEIFLSGRTIYCFHNDVYFYYFRFSFRYLRYACNANVNGICFRPPMLSYERTAHGIFQNVI